MKVRRIESVYDVSKKRVAAYARVSTLSELQEESYETQVNYYTEFIRHVEGWEFVKVYTDQGITGTSVEKRPGFKEMLEAAERHEFDILLVKSVSRFARNTVDALKYVHRFRELNIEIRFEKEGLSTFNPSTEMILNMMAVVAQEESHTLSANMRWSYQKFAERGIRHLGSNRVLGYDEIDGKLTPNKDAWIVRQVFEDYAAGLPVATIIKRLDKSGARTLRTGKRFQHSNIMKILRNEEYVGDRILEKSAPRNFLTKKPNPTIPYDSFYLKDAHEAIVSRELWEIAQQRIKKQAVEREQGLYRSSNCHFLYGKVVCGNCGNYYVRMLAKTKKGAMIHEWICRDRRAGKKGGGCKNTTVREEELLKDISSKLGWTWNGIETFDSQTFEELVSRIEIRGGAINVILKEVA